MKKSKGYVQIYTGDGKGKTTAALGLGLRAVGRDLRVLMVQFLKGRETGELEGIKRLAPEFQIIRFAQSHKFFFQLDQEEKEELKERVNKELKTLYEYMENDMCHILILDEIMATMENGLVEVERVCNIIDSKPPGMELILTGRNVPEAIAAKADLITEMKKVKHYAEEGVSARIGIEL